jgi:hypothetical protein
MTQIFIFLIVFVNPIFGCLSESYPTQTVRILLRYHEFLFKEILCNILFNSLLQIYDKFFRKIFNVVQLS